MHLRAWELRTPARTPRKPHLYAGGTQQDHDLINEAQQGQEHRVLVVEPLTEEQREGDVGRGPAKQGQGEGLA